jgi:selenocysteine-specific elongation factor
MIVATAGHVDHGKTSLLQALTGGRLDRRPEEQRRGMTIDLGFSYLPVDSGGDPIGFVDVPGHQDFIRNMLCGVAGSDFALLVVAADDGPRAQTFEHLSILDLLGVSRGAIVLTKIDRVSPARLAAVRNEVTGLCAGTSLGGAPLFEVCAPSGAGVAPLRAHLRFVASRTTAREAVGNFRLAIDRSFTLPGTGLIVTGFVASGQLAVGDSVQLLGTGKLARARSIHAQNRSSATACAGQRCAINLAGGGFGPDDAARGEWLVAGEPPPRVQKMDARLHVAPAGSRPLMHWTPVHVHVATSHATGRIAILDGSEIQPGHSGLVQLVLDRPLSALHADCFIVRDQSAQRTLGGGRVIDLFPPVRGRSRPARLGELAAIELDSPATALDSLLAQAREGVDLARFKANRGFTEREGEALDHTARMVQIPTPAGPRAFSEATWNELRCTVLAELAEWHERSPATSGPPADALLKSRRLPRATVLAVVARLAQEGVIRKSGLGVHLPDHRPRLAGADQARWEAIAPILREGGLRPPSVPLISFALGDPPKVIDDTLGHAARCGHVIRVAPGRYYLPAPLFELACIVQSLARRDGHATVPSLRDASGIGRRIAVEVMDFFDRVKFTRRIADTHVVVCDPRDIFAAGDSNAPAPGRESDPGGPLGLQIRWEASDVSGGFDSHALPPHSTEVRP